LRLGNRLGRTLPNPSILSTIWRRDCRSKIGLLSGILFSSLIVLDLYKIDNIHQVAIDIERESPESFYPFLVSPTSQALLKAGE
jgi:hypothetical protein